MTEHINSGSSELQTRTNLAQKESVSQGQDKDRSLSNELNSTVNAQTSVTDCDIVQTQSHSLDAGSTCEKESPAGQISGQSVEVTTTPRKRRGGRGRSTRQTEVRIGPKSPKRRRRKSGEKNQVIPNAAY